MGREIVMLVLLGGLVAVAAALFTVALELFNRRRKQDQYDSLHRRMGLDPEAPKFPRNED